MKKIFLALGLVLGTSTVASASNGVFCNPQNQIVEWICQEVPRGDGWVPQADGCFHRNTYRSCSGGGGGGGHEYELADVIFKVTNRSATFYADQNGGYCQFRSEQDVRRFRQSEGLRGTEYVNRIPQTLRYTGSCQVW